MPLIRGPELNGGNIVQMKNSLIAKTDFQWRSKMPLVFKIYCLRQDPKNQSFPGNIENADEMMQSTKIIHLQT